MKNTIKATALATVLMFGATVANAGIMVSDGREAECTVEIKGIIAGGAPTPGIIAGGSPIVAGVVAVLEGIIAGGKPEPAPCVEKNGIMVSD